jgi:hypothetical protein
VTHTDAVSVLEDMANSGEQQAAIMAPGSTAYNEQKHDIEKELKNDVNQAVPNDPSSKGYVLDDSPTSEHDANIVWWDGDNDLENPYNWPTWRKILNCGLISALSFVAPLASCECSGLSLQRISKGLQR